MKKIVFYIFLILNTNFLLISTNIKQKGIIDFAELKIKNQKEWYINLDTEWEFYFNKFLFSEDFKNNNIQKEYILVPGFWNLQKKSFNRYGYGTYRLVLKNVPQDILSIDIPRVFSAYRLFINGELIKEKGRVGKNKKESLPSFGREILTFNSKNKELEIIFHISNYSEYRGGGIFRNIKIGNVYAIYKRFTLSLLLDISSIAILIFVIIYHLSIFIFTNKKDKGFIYISLFAFLYIIRIMFTNSNLILYLFPNLSYNIFYRIEILTLFLSIPFFLFFFKRLFYYEAKKIFIYIYMILAGFFTILNLFLPQDCFSITLLFSYILLVFVMGTVFVWSINAIIDKKKDSIIFLFSFLILIGTGLNDIFFSLLVIRTLYLLPIGIAIFIFIQIFILNKRFLYSYEIIENFSDNLFKSKDQLLNINTILEEKVKERTKELEKKIEENERMKEQIFRMQKIEALSFIASGVAHDFNNILSIILSNISLIKINKENTTEIDTYIYNIENALKNASNFINQLLTFSTGENEDLKVNIDLFSLLDEILKFVLTGTQIKYRFLSKKNGYYVYGDRGQIYQVFLNIIVNAKQAMENRGEIEVSIEILTDNNKYNIREDLKFIKIDIKDNGPGIPEENLSKIFDIFWSNKKEGKGIGLAMTYYIVQKHNGYIFVDSTEGVGTTFTILLPVSNKKNCINDKESNETIAAKNNSRVLILDDEEAILDLTSCILEKNGFEVFKEDNIEDAFNLYKNLLEKNNRIDFVIVDLNIDGNITGLDFIKKILNIDNNALFVLSTGTPDLININLKEYNILDILKKPYSYENLTLLTKKIMKFKKDFKVINSH
ncbi:MAG TPA: 7TM diverse intracellular signaling domain-containing protein [Spirochaetota bacterium]|nr:7TM diverse intracellular signaling domain-containing protein [Spirochaetota bacterium]